MADFRGNGLGLGSKTVPANYNLKDELVQAGLLTNGVMPVTGDIQSGLLALNDVKNGDYKSAALNGLGLLPFVPALAGTFIGKGAKTWDAVNAGKAMKMADKGVDERAIWAKTGTFKGADGQWRQEISDHAASSSTINPDGLGGYSLDGVIKNYDALNAYPSLKGINVKTSDKTYFSPSENTIASSDFTNKQVFGKHYQHQEDRIYKIADKLESTGIASNNAERRLQNMLDSLDNKAEGRVDGYVDKTTFDVSPLLHESQHAIQKIEGWNKGGSVREFAEPQMLKSRAIYDQIDNLNKQLSAAAGTPEYQTLMNIKMDLVDQVKGIDQFKILEDANNNYRNLAGEAEARATQARMNLTPQERLAKFPFDSYDVPRESLIVRGLLGMNK